ncbi:MAG TPA: hypothetical protein VG713_15560 [Pirellulales bacterium]|nr:hypothetical protein [Pirellulales bacterium]
MDKVKQYWAQFKKHHFWVLCGVILIASLVTWNMATNQVRAKYEENQRTIKSTYSTLLALKQKTSPNESYIKALAGEETKIRGQVNRATEVAFKEQKKVLPWPKEVADAAKLKSTDEIPLALRDNYQNLVILPELNRIFEKVQLRKEKPRAGGGPMGNPMGGASAGPVDYQGIVNWKADDRQRIIDRYRVTSRPSTIRMRTTQEDLWAFESLVDIVLQLNKGATDNLNATVKEIDMFAVAQWATRHDQEHPGADLGIEGAPADGNAVGVAPGGESPLVQLPDQAGQAIGESAPKDPDMVLLEGRYLDADNNPVAADAALGYFRKQGAGGEQPVGNPPFAEFKQMAVVMKFLMDQRKVPELLAACANSPLPIEVRQVLMQLIDTDSKEVDPEARHAGERGPFDASIEVRGIVYIYTEPDEKKLGTGSAPRPAQRSFGVPIPSTGGGAAAPPPAQPIF